MSTSSEQPVPLSPSNVLGELAARGLLQQCTGVEALAEALEQGSCTLYIGYDPTGDSLHVGHLVTLMAVRWLHRAGHRVVVVVGGATALVGDPSGKSEMRPMLSAEVIAHNADCLHAQVQRVLGTQERVTLTNNASWLAPLGWLSLLREVGRHFSVNRMLAAESYRARLETGLSFLEFNYQVLQAYDFLHLARTEGCVLQLGGDDQWGNILAGVELCRRSAQKQVHGLTVPLLTTASGAKMGKTAQGAVWLDARKLSANDFFQYWSNCDDRDLGRFLRLYTTLPLAEIAAAVPAPPQATGAAGTPADLLAKKRILAYEITCTVHGREAAVAALKAAVAAFGGAALPAALLPTSAVPRDLAAAAVTAADAAGVSLHALVGPAPWPLPAILVALGWAKSNNEARRLMDQGGVRLEGQAAPLTDPQAALAAGDVAASGRFLQAGKKRRIRLFP